jgi:type IV pilus assembly protein PilE
MNIAARQQQMLLDTRSYASTVAALNITVPATVQQTYSVAITVGTAAVPSFTATATPSGSQAADKCGTMSIIQTGVKSPTTCW